MELKFINEFVFENNTLCSIFQKSFGREISQKGKEHRLFNGLKVRPDKELIGNKKKLAAVNADSIKAYRCNTNGCQGRYHVYIKDGIEIGFENTKKHTKCVEKIVINEVFHENEQTLQFLENHDENTGDENYLEPITDSSTNQYIIFENTKNNKQQFSLMSIDKLNKEINDPEVGKLLDELKQIDKDANQECSYETTCFQNVSNNSDNYEVNLITKDERMVDSELVINKSDNTITETSIYEPLESEIVNLNVGYCDESGTNERMPIYELNSFTESSVLKMMEMLVSDETQDKLNNQSNQSSTVTANLDEIYNNLYGCESYEVVFKLDQDESYNQDSTNNNMNPIDLNNNPTYSAQQSQSFMFTSNSPPMSLENINTFGSNLEGIIQNNPFDNPDSYNNIGNEVLLPDDLNFGDEQMDFDF